MEATDKKSFNKKSGFQKYIWWYNICICSVILLCTLYSTYKYSSSVSRIEDLYFLIVVYIVTIINLLFLIIYLIIKMVKKKFLEAFFLFLNIIILGCITTIQGTIFFLMISIAGGAK
jgi:hypothetical protein